MAAVTHAIGGLKAHHHGPALRAQPLIVKHELRCHPLGGLGTLSLGMRILNAEGVEVDALLAHGGLFRTAGVAQRLLAAAVGTNVAVGETASEGGAWGIAVLAAYSSAVRTQPDLTLASYLDDQVFASATTVVVEPDPDDMIGYARFLEAYEAGLAIEHAAIAAV